MSNIVIAIDGPAASGKGTISKAISEKLKFNYLDTGKLYRAIGAKYLEGYPPIAAAQSLDGKDLEKYDLQKQEIAQAASEIALIPEVRAALLEFQRNFSQKMPGAVLDGRDIGTIICPGADYKFFVDAAIEVRAGRRAKELREKGDPSIYSRVLHDMKERDLRDRTRKVAPLAPAADASVINTTNLNADAAFAEAMSIIR